jgi:hypothetical protein
MAKKHLSKLKRIDEGFIIPSGLGSVPKNELVYIGEYIKKPRVGDVVYCRVTAISQHVRLENKHGRIHNLYNGSEFIGVFGNRYAPDQFEAIVPSRRTRKVDLFSWGGLVGQVLHKNDAMRDPTQVEIIGSIYNAKGKPVNTLQYQLIRSRTKQVKKPRAKMILVCGTAMNSGKSTTAAAIIWSLKRAGHHVRAAKVTGTASLKDILLMNDAGAKYFADFTSLGYPSTYMLDLPELEVIFNSLDLRYANNPENYWVVEFADGISQRETAMLLHSQMVRDRIDKLIFCAADTFGAIGGVEMLRKEFKLEPDAISGVCTSSPLFVEEIKKYLELPVINNTSVDHRELLKTLGIKKSNRN